MPLSHPQLRLHLALGLVFAAVLASGTAAWTWSPVPSVKAVTTIRVIPTAGRSTTTSSASSNCRRSTTRCGSRPRSRPSVTLLPATGLSPRSRATTSVTGSPVTGRPSTASSRSPGRTSARAAGPSPRTRETVTTPSGPRTTHRPTPA